MERIHLASRLHGGPCRIGKLVGRLSGNCSTASFLWCKFVHKVERGREETFSGFHFSTSTTFFSIFFPTALCARKCREFSRSLPYSYSHMSFHGSSVFVLMAPPRPEGKGRKTFFSISKVLCSFFPFVIWEYVLHSRSHSFPFVHGPLSPRVCGWEFAALVWDFPLFLLAYFSHFYYHTFFSLSPVIFTTQCSGVMIYCLLAYTEISFSAMDISEPVCHLWYKPPSSFSLPSTQTKWVGLRVMLQAGEAEWGQIIISRLVFAGNSRLSLSLHTALSKTHFLQIDFIRHSCLCLKQENLDFPSG